MLANINNFSMAFNSTTIVAKIYASLLVKYLFAIPNWNIYNTFMSIPSCDFLNIILSCYIDCLFLVCHVAITFEINNNIAYCQPTNLWLLEGLRELISSYISVLMNNQINERGSDSFPFRLSHLSSVATYL